MMPPGPAIFLSRPSFIILERLVVRDLENKAMIQEEGEGVPLLLSALQHCFFGHAA